MLHISSVTWFLSLNCYKRVFFFLTDVKTNYIWWLNGILLRRFMHRIASVEEYKNQFSLSSPLNVFHYLVLRLRIESRTKKKKKELSQEQPKMLKALC